MNKIIIFGAGQLGRKYMTYPNIRNKVIALTDNNPALWGSAIEGVSVIRPEEIIQLDFDKISITISDVQMMKAVKQQLLSFAIPEEKIITFREIPLYVIWGYNEIGRNLLMYEDIGSFGELYVDPNPHFWGKTYCGVPIKSPEILQELTSFGQIVVACEQSVRKENLQYLSDLNIPDEAIAFLGDFIEDHTKSARFLWMKDYSKWLNMQNLSGSVAECGVFMGDSAKFLNEFFPDRNLYLFDTFAGFAEEDILKERSLNNSKFLEGVFNRIGHLCNPYVDIVMRKMNYPERIIIKKGLFPKSAEGIDDQFCFVNLDMDLYQPMIAALQFFWDKLVPGGCVVLHDYFHPQLPGVKQAVSDFEKQIGVRLFKTVLGDGCSIALLK